MDTFAQAVLIIHIAAGFVALMVGPVAMAAAKGGRLHRRAGRLYVGAMAFVVTSAAMLAFYGSDTFLLAIAVLSFYLTFTGYRALFQKKLHQGEGVTFLDWVISSVTLLFGVGLLLQGVGFFGAFDVIALFFGVTTVVLTWGSFRRYRGAAEQGDWFFNHIIGMLAAYIATFTAFAVTNLTFVPVVLVWTLPTIVGSLGITWVITSYKSRLAMGRKLRELVTVRTDEV